MSLFPGDSQVLGPLFGDPTIAALFTDRAAAARMAEVEVALARAQAAAGVIPTEAADQIAEAVTAFEPDLDRIGASTARNGVPTLELIAQLRAAAGPAGAWVSWGATSQDIMDSALVLQIRDTLEALERGVLDVITRLADLAQTHRDTLMVARTRSQQALPTTFGAKVAGWLAPLLRHRDRLGELRQRVLVVQLGGGAGTLASLGDAAPEVVERFATELGLGVPAMPWHNQRDGIGEVAGWCAGLTGSLGKLARDVVLMSQSEVGELVESPAGKGAGSSTMPQKRNPIRSEAVVAAATTAGPLASAVHTAQIHEHERDGSAWQVEWLVLPQLLALTGGALQNTARVLGDMEVRTDRMRANVDASGGLLLSEAASLALAPHLGREPAHEAVRTAAGRAQTSGRHLIDELASEFGHLPVSWDRLRSESSYLGVTSAWVDAVVARARL